MDEAVSKSIDGSLLLGFDLDQGLKLDAQDSIIFNSSLTSPNTITELPTKAYVDSLHNSRRNRRDLFTVFTDEDKECIINI